MNNFGLIVQPSDSDFVAGGPIQFENRNSTANWFQFFSSPDKQSFPWGDTEGCVSFSAVHHLFCTQVNWMIANNLLPQSTLDFLNLHGYIQDNKIRFSERYIVVRSGTTSQGNSVQNVFQAIRKFGLVPYSLCPNEGPISRDQYFTIPDNCDAIGKQFLTYFTASWQQIPAPLISKYLIQAPILILTPVCAGWSTDNPVKTCDQPVQHATAVYAINNYAYEIEDQYAPFEKVLARDYPIPYAHQLIVYPVPQPKDFPTPLKLHLFNIDMKLGDRGQEVLFLQQRLGCPLTGIYDDATRVAVFSFQLNHIPSTFTEMIVNLFGRYCGPLTRKILNS